MAFPQHNPLKKKQKNKCHATEKLCVSSSAHGPSSRSDFTPGFLIVELRLASDCPHFVKIELDKGLEPLTMGFGGQVPEHRGFLAPFLL